MRGLVERCGRLARNMAGDRKGNVTLIFAISVVPILLALGSGVDYGLAMKRQARMNAAADAAALYAVTPAMMQQSATVAKAASIAFFNSQVAAIPGTTYNTGNLQISVTDTSSASSVKRVATATYAAGSTNNFASILQVPTLTIKGTSTASAATSPNIDFYLMLDTSPSMAIAATQDGINLMVSKTPQQSGGCAFACHETNPVTYNPTSNDVTGNPNNEDNYALARSLGVTLRIDMVNQAVQNLTTTASQTSQSTGAAYRMAGYSFDIAVNNIMPLTSNMTTAKNEASNLAVLTVYHENMLTATNANSDQDTDFNNAFSNLNQVMPAPGNGTNAANDTPQEVLFIVTDGVADINYNGRKYGPFGTGTYTGTDWCTAIKARNIRIAVLYTVYYPLPTNSWYNTYISGEQASIGSTAQTCASPGLYFAVATGGDISSAMSTLFATAVSSAHLTN